jgi:hypothetical protein
MAGEWDVGREDALEHDSARSTEEVRGKVRSELGLDGTGVSVRSGNSTPAITRALQHHDKRHVSFPDAHDKGEKVEGRRT